MNVQDQAPMPETLWPDQVNRWLLPPSRKPGRGAPTTESDGEAPSCAAARRSPTIWPRVFPGL